MNRADCFYGMKQYHDAIDDLQTALEINPEEDNPQVLYKLGLTYYAFGKYRRCVKTLKRALQAGPYITYQADIYYHVGLAFCRLERYGDSIFPFSAAIKMIPGDIRF